MKGLELPINMIVVVAIAVLVLVVVTAFFVGGTGGFDPNLQAAFGTGCGTLRSVYNCVSADVSSIKVQGYTPPGQQADPSGWSFSNICQRKGFANDVDCAKACGCTA